MHTMTKSNTSTALNLLGAVLHMLPTTKPDRYNPGLYERRLTVRADLDRAFRFLSRDNIPAARLALADASGASIPRDELVPELCDVALAAGRLLDADEFAHHEMVAAAVEAGMKMHREAGHAG